MNRKPTIILSFLLTATFAISGFFLGRNFPSDNKENVQAAVPKHAQLIVKRLENPSTYKFINPLLECDNYYPSNIAALETLENELNAYIEKVKSDGIATDVAVYLRVLNSGPWIGVHEDMNFAPASLLKVPIMIAVLKKSESETGLLKEKILYRPGLEPIFTQNIADTAQMKTGSYYTVEELIERSITYSDNDANEMLFAVAGENHITKVMEDIGLSLTGKKPSDDIVSVKTYSSFFRLLYNGTYLNRELSEKALFILSKTNFKMGLPKYLPAGIVVAHKFGERGLAGTNMKQLHDCGIVYLNRNPYLICVMTRGTDFNQLSEVIATTSKIIFDEMSRFNKN